MSYSTCQGSNHAANAKTKEPQEMHLNTSNTATSTNLTDDLVNLDECARLTGLKTRTISLYVSMNQIPSRKIGTSRLFSRREILKWIERRELIRRELRELRWSASGIGLNR